MTSRPKDDLLTPSQVAELWKVSLRTVQRYIANGQIKAVRLPGRQYRVRRSEAEAAIAEVGA